MSRGVPSTVSDQTDTEARDSGTDSQYECPLCEFDAGERTNLYIHLQTSHRKSRLATVILEERTHS